MPTTDSERPRVLPLTMMNFVLTHVYCMYTSRQNGKDIAFYVFMDKEKLDIWVRITGGQCALGSVNVNGIFGTGQSDRFLMIKLLSAIFVLLHSF